MTFPGRFAMLAAFGVAALAQPAAAAGPIHAKAAPDPVAAMLLACDASHRSAIMQGVPPEEPDPASLKPAHAAEIDNASTFEALGLGQAAADKFLATPTGHRFLKELGAADPSADAAKIYARAVDQLSTGSAAPVRLATAAGLVKIVPAGQTVSPYSPYFTTVHGLAMACRAKRRLADAFALPLKSEAASYDVYEIKPNKAPADTFVAPIAPTSELDGLVKRQGGAKQDLVPNRGLWAAPVMLGTIAGP